MVILLLSGLFLAEKGSAQNGFGSWTGAGLSYQYSKKLRFDLDAELRTDQNLHRTEQYFFSPGVKYDFSKVFRLGTDYRMSVVAKDSDIGNRATLEAEFRKLASTYMGAKRFDLEFRLRTTYMAFRNARSETFLRGRLLASYNLPKTKLKPEISSELFYRFDDELVYTTDRVYGVNRFTKLRLRAGFDYPFGQHSVNLYYQIQTDLGQSTSDHIIGLNYRYTIDRK